MKLIKKKITTSLLNYNLLNIQILIFLFNININSILLKTLKKKWNPSYSFFKYSNFFNMPLSVLSLTLNKNNLNKFFLMFKKYSLGYKILNTYFLISTLTLFNYLQFIEISIFFFTFKKIFRYFIRFLFFFKNFKNVN